MTKNGWRRNQTKILFFLIWKSWRNGHLAFLLFILFFFTKQVGKFPTVQGKLFLGGEGKCIYAILVTCKNESVVKL